MHVVGILSRIVVVILILHVEVFALQVVRERRIAGVLRCPLTCESTMSLVVLTLFSVLHDLLVLSIQLADVDLKTTRPFKLHRLIAGLVGSGVLVEANRWSVVEAISPWLLLGSKKSRRLTLKLLRNLSTRASCRYRTQATCPSSSR